MDRTMSFYVAMEFKVLRRIGWEGELDQLRAHVDAVCEHLEARPEIVEWNLTGDLTTATLEVELVVDAVSADEADAAARDVLGTSIRRAGAMHEGLLSLREESEARITANAWHGLRTPRWQPRRFQLSKI